MGAWIGTIIDAVAASSACWPARRRPGQAGHRDLRHHRRRGCRCPGRRRRSPRPRESPIPLGIDLDQSGTAERRSRPAASASWRSRRTTHSSADPLDAGTAGLRRPASGRAGSRAAAGPRRCAMSACIEAATNVMPLSCSLAGWPTVTPEWQRRRPVPVPAPRTGSSGRSRSAMRRWNSAISPSARLMWRMTGHLDLSREHVRAKVIDATATGFGAANAVAVSLDGHR